MNDDTDAWIKYPKHRNFFNKLWLSDQLGYKCGPAGLPPLQSGEYVVRPIYNLRGMGLGARFEWIEANDWNALDPGYFWCEKFTGRHISASFEFVHGKIGQWKPVSAFEGFRDKDAPLYKFNKWIKVSVDDVPFVPRLLNVLSDVKHINIEFIGNKVIEVHLRETPDPDYDELIPVWESDQIESSNQFIKSEDDADGRLPEKRLGFFVRNC